MPRKTTGLIVSALAAALLAGAGPAVSATVMEAQTVSVFHTVTTHDPRFQFTDVTTSSLHFDAFDPSLGTLTGAEWGLRSNADFGSGVSAVGDGGGAILFTGRSTSHLDLDGVMLGVHPEVQSPPGWVSCGVFADPFCIAVDHQTEAYDFDAAASDLAPFLAPGGVDVTAVSEILLDGLIVGNGVGTANGTLDWNGQLSLTYSYDAATSLPPATGVPEPAGWTLAVAGFALAGAAPRRRRGLARAWPFSAARSARPGPPSPA